MKAVIFNESGEILRTVECPDGEIEFQTKAGEFWIEGEANVMTDSVDVLSSLVVRGGRAAPESKAMNYSQARIAMYPRVEEQLDMLWHAMDSMQINRAEPFYSSIKAVKDANPKPDDGFVFEVTGG